MSRHFVHLLSPDQIDTVNAAAEQLPPSKRERFIHRVVARLRLNRHVEAYTDKMLAHIMELVFLELAA